MLCDSGVLAVSYERPEQPLDLITEACFNSGLALGTEVQLALNCAAPELMDYVSEPAAGSLLPLSHQRGSRAGSELEPEKHRFFLFTPQRSRIIAAIGWNQYMGCTGCHDSCPTIT